MQWLLLKKWVYKARWWILANTIGWAVGEVLLWAIIFCVMDGGRLIVNGVVTNPSTIEGKAVVLLSCAVTGVITDVPLTGLLRDSGESNRNT